MRSVSVVNVSTGEILAKQALVAETMFSRFMGLQGKRSLPEGGGLILMPTNAIHTLFMMMAIDAVFISQAGKVLRIGRRLHPWRLGPIVPHALYCVELPAEKAAATDIGHTIELRPPVDPGAVGGGSGQEGCSIRSI
jgi:uncharacterized membrane protein (UPF0127 family)